MRIMMQCQLRGCLLPALLVSTVLVGCITLVTPSERTPAATQSPAAGESQPRNKQAEGNLTKEEVEGVIRSHLPAIKACYERSLKINPNIKGRVLTSFEIGVNGKVNRSEIANSTLNNPATEQCVAQVIKQWQFPVPRGKGVVRVTYPFTFDPK